MSKAEFDVLVVHLYRELQGSLLPAQLKIAQLTNRVDKNLVTRPDSPVPDCQTCGACCRIFLCTGVQNEKIDPRYYWNVTVASRDRDVVVDRFLKRDDETLACSCLSGNVGESVSCTIYEDRPKMCRNFEAGSDKCHGARRAVGLEPFLSTDEMPSSMELLRAARREMHSSEKIRSTEIGPFDDSGLLGITVTLGDGQERRIHTYDPEMESWLRFEFDGLTLGGAIEMIASRDSENA